MFRGQVENCFRFPQAEKREVYPIVTGAADPADE